jgi:hypothetical protein
MISRKLLAVAPMAALVGLAMPAAAAPAAVGVVTGTVTVTPAIPPVTCTATSYTFGSTVVAGAFGTNVGTVNVTASGGSACENLSGAAGSVTGQINGGLLGGAGFSKCDLGGGTFVRTGPVVTVNIPTLTAEVGGSCQGLSNAQVPASLFIPTPNANPLGETTAVFAGLFTAS